MGMTPEQRIAQLEYRMQAIEKDFRDVSLGTTERTDELARAHNVMAGNLRVLARKVGILPQHSWWRRMAAIVMPAAKKQAASGAAQ